MFRFERPVRFAEVDPARVVFFPHVGAYCHDALEALLAELPGGYAALVADRDLGIPTARFDVDFRAPLRYGDVAVIMVEIERIGRSSVALRYVIRRRADDVLCALVRHVIVVARMSTFTSEPIPADMKSVLQAHLAR